MNANLRPAAVAGTFYPGDTLTLKKTLGQLLDKVPESALPQPKAIIAPHAGYIYSGPIAASIYAPLRRLHQTIRRVVLLGPTHRVAVDGLALPASSGFVTPLGQVTIDAQAVELLRDLPQVLVSEAAHAQEHSLEVQLPFLQSVFDDFSLLPLAVGRASPEQVAEVLERLWGGEETLIVVSSDLSHYLPYADAQITDSETVQRILDLDPTVRHDAACGATPINGLLLAARRHGLQASLVDLRNSGDTAGDKARVVGYAAFAFTASETDSDTLGPTLLTIARNALNQHFSLPTHPVTPHPALALPAATFVTLTQAGNLRGCIGTLEAHRPLGEDVAGNALSAALRDPRFRPLSADELARTRVEVSLLEAAQPFVCSDEADALVRLRPGVDGLILRHGHRRATFLPQVWESLPKPRHFLQQLKLKAGLPADFWDEEIRLARYGVQKWKET